jgi:hypothetical protein
LQKAAEADAVAKKHEPEAELFETRSGHVKASDMTFRTTSSCDYY